MPSHTLRTAVRLGTGQTITPAAELTITADADANIIAATIAASQTNLVHNIAVDVSALSSLYMLASVNMSVYVNDASTGSPTATIALKAGDPFVWNSTSNYFSNPLGASDVTAVYITNTTAGTFTMLTVQDPTP